MSFFIGNPVTPFNPDVTPSFVNACITNFSSVNACITYGTFYNLSCNSLYVANVIQENTEIVTNGSFMNACILNASIWNANITSGNVSVPSACISNLSTVSACITYGVFYNLSCNSLTVFNLTRGLRSLRHAKF